MSSYADSEYQDDPNTPWYKVLKLIKSNTTVLDYGCSSGNFGRILIEKKNCIVDGVELDESDAKEASKSLRKVYGKNIEIDGDEFLGNSKYDVIYFGDVIEHLVNPSRVLNMLKTHLHEQGCLIFSVPNMAHMSVRLAILEGIFPYGEMGLLDKTHLHFYDQEEIRRVIHEAGYELIELDYVKRDIPRDVLKKELRSRGLTASKDFLDDSKNIGASAYQYIGMAKPSSKLKKLPPRPILSPPINEMEKHIDYVKKVHNAQINSYKKEIERLTSQIKQINKAVEEERKDFERYKSKRLIKIADRLHKSKDR